MSDLDPRPATGFTEAANSTAVVDFDDGRGVGPVSYTHLRAHDTVLDIVCRLLLGHTNDTFTKLPQDTYPRRQTNTD